MTFSYLILQDKAVRELEQIFVDSGYISGRNIKDDEKEIRATTSPIFYRNITHAYAPVANIKKSGSVKQASLFLYYSQTQSRLFGAEDMAAAITQSFSVTLQFDNAYLWLRDNDNKFLLYLDNLIINLERQLWTITDLGERTIQAVEGQNKYAFQKQYIVEKIF